MPERQKTTSGNEMEFERAREIAAGLYSVGRKRVRIDSAKLADVQKAITRGDVKGLVADGSIKIERKKGLSRGRARIRHERKKQGRYRSPGSKKGTLKARSNPKEQWKTKVRSLRKALLLHKLKKEVTGELYKECYLKIKGNWFRNKKHLEQFIAEKTGKSE